jgi:hypothetical protein
MTCYPDYIFDHTTKPSYVPFRALMVGNASNLLVAGKTMSQTFHANGATRLHPSEWTTGVAAAGTAVLMVRNGWTTADAYSHIDAVRSYLNSSAIGQPLEWAGAAATGQAGYACQLGRCIGVDERTKARCPEPTCNHQCRELAPNEWLAYSEYWKREANDTLVATQVTVLKKSTTSAQQLPPNETLRVNAEAHCQLLNTTSEYESYFLCAYEDEQ